MKKTTLITTSALTLATLVGTSVTVLAAPGEIPANYDSNAVVKFIPDDSTTPPVDPINPVDPVSPVDPTNPDGPNPGTNGPLSIDFASSFYFGENKITSKDKVYNATPQELSDGSTRPNYAQVTDNRGGAKGWKLQVKQNGQFKTTAGEELTGAMMSFKNGQSASESTSPVPSVVKDSFDLTTDGTGAVEDIMAATAGEGAGTWVYRFGDDVTKSESVTLSVPGKTTKMADAYSTSLTWTLTDVPDGSGTPEL